MRGLLDQVEIQQDLRILSSEVLAKAQTPASRLSAPQQVGTLRVELWPCAQDGTPGVPDADLVDEPKELLGTRMVVLVHVVRANGLPDDLALDPRVEFEYFLGDIPHQVSPILGHTCDPQFDFKRVLVQDPVTSRFLDHCSKRSIVFRVYGSDADARRLQSEAAAQVRETIGLDTSVGSTTVGTMAGVTDVVTALQSNSLGTSIGFGSSIALTSLPTPHGHVREEQSEFDGETPRQATETPTLSQVRRDVEEVVNSNATGEAAKGKKKSKACVVL